ncbi:HSP20-like chaperone [Terfezia boudieri ATCC MYA-4762]|uniref:HSP20-like chaperone n=1 Tax=Terfezia boudieri ATCC MYA-4762 TaxID=1051890 RepID=A0A3N4LQ90_9PEZI|nr:HSP20-like chaperone [Terfezia boudieri ATCC MYA-4762]
MPLFPRFVHTSQQDRASNIPDIYTLLSQLAAGQANASSYHHQSPSHSSPGNATHHQGHSHIRAFTPSFDVIETKEAYILEGEVPGLSDKGALDIEFTDQQTLLVKGKIEKAATASEPQSEAKQITSGEEHHERPKSPPKPTVEDVIDEVDDGKSNILTPTSTIGSHEEQKSEQRSKKQQIRYWISERTIGSFQRTFSFPGLIDQDKVTAKLENGILIIVVPKRQKLPSRKIVVQ